ncbi:serine/threonine-protein kinase [Pseudonocardia nigra]|uniref:serine/threonine-protein kinase n=1 Tax=Pseudonocardia nigra TaxID=1921578 RepID=UPI001C607347|nr:serine/threonine-protein kinase [Pseudonocardia nigra]
MGGVREDPPADLVAGRYRPRQLVGAGGMGTVWRATDELLGREVAIKRVRLGDLPPAQVAAARERTMREARIAAALHHPHVVSIFDVVVEDDEPWLILEFVDSRSLGGVLDERGPLPPAEVAAIGAQVAGALAAAHEAGIVHRDVKPDNVLIDRSRTRRPGERVPLVKLTDFGIAHIADAPTITASHLLTGTPAYFAPETARGQGTDPRSDVYALGATLYTAMEGHPPFGSGDDNVLGLLSRIARGDVPPPRRAGPLTDLLRRLMADDPDARPTAAQAHLELDRLSDTRTSAAATVVGPAAPTAPVDTLVTAPVPRRRRMAVAVVGVLTMAAAAVAVTIAAFTPDPPGSARPASGAAATGAPAANGGTVAIADPEIADPCSLMDPDALAEYGSTALDRHNATFAGCRIDIVRPGGSRVSVAAMFENAQEVVLATDGTEGQMRGFTVLRFPHGGSLCQRRVLLADGNGVLLTATAHDPAADTGALCAIAESGMVTVVDRLTEGGLGVRARLDAASPLAGIEACTLLAAPDLAGIPGLSPGRPRFAGWGCIWSTNTAPRLDIHLWYMRRPPLVPDDGVAADFAGRPGTVRAGAGHCLVQFVQRRYAAGGTDRVETVALTHYGSGSPDDLCRTATALATAAATKLPLPT